MRTRIVLVSLLGLACGTEADTSPASQDTADTSGQVPEDVLPDAPHDEGPSPELVADPDAPDTAEPPPKLVLANAVPSGDPRAEGEWQFLHETWGTEVGDNQPPAAFLLNLMASEPDVFGNQFEKFGFIPDPEDEFPVGLKRGTSDPERVNETCALCHVARLPDGRLWAGAPNAALDPRRFAVEVDKRWEAAGNPPRMTAEQREKALAVQPGRTNAESDDHPTVVPADFPAYYQLGARTTLNYLGTGASARTECYFSIYTFGAGNPNDEEALVPFPPEDKLAHLVGYIGSLVAPPGIQEDEAAIARGAAVFTAARCATCHHPDDPAKDKIVAYDYAADGLERHPGDDPKWPRGSIRTSQAHRVLIDGDGSGGGDDEGYADLLIFIATHGIEVRSSDGYRATGITGLWHTAPYLHNGSVPTLEDLLRPAADRPKTFSVQGVERDTSAPGNSNQGHEFGTTLPEADKADLIAYLRSL